MITFSDQQAYLELVRPPSGHRLTYCLGTTFSLDLECVVAMAHVAAKNSWAEEGADPDVYEALQGIAEFAQNSLVLFQACQIKALEREQAALHAKKYGRLISLLDQFVLPVSAPGIKASFHPKVWLVRFDVDHGIGQSIYRLLVTSRNLSNQMDWEIGCILEGRKVAKANDLSFLNALADLQTVAFQKPPRTKGAQFLAKDLQNKNVLLAKPSVYAGLIVISPFISSRMISSLASGIADPNQFYLVTVPGCSFKIQELTQIHSHSFVFDPAEVNVEGAGDVRMGLHAKIYVGLRADGSGTDLLLGSANCTTRGLRGANTEAVVRLDLPASAFKEFLASFVYQEMKKETPYGWLRKFRPLSPEELQLAKNAAAQEKLLSDIRATLAAGRFRLHVESGAKRARLYFKRPKNFAIAKDARIDVAPWGCPRSKSLTSCMAPKGAHFSSTEGFRSDFVQIEVRLGMLPSLKFMTVATSNINKRTRNKAVLGSYLQQPSAFYRYLRLILKMPATTGYRDTSAGSGGSRKKKRELARVVETSFLEEVLVNASRNQSVINQIDEALDAADRADETLDDFRQFWRRFMEAHREVVRDE
jgi:hypothetical protein